MAGSFEAFDYRQAVVTADRLINRFGAYGSIRHEGADYRCLMVATSNTQRERNASLEMMALQRIYMSASGLPFAPTTYDIVTTPDGKQRRVRSCYPMRPATTTIFYELQVEGA